MTVGRMTKDYYQLCCRLTRLRYKTQFTNPAMLKQPTALLTTFMHQIYGHVVPFSLRPHFDKVSLRWEREKPWYFENFYHRWEYHHMLAEGQIETWQEYETLIKERRQDAENWDYDDSDPYYSDQWADDY